MFHGVIQKIEVARFFIETRYIVKHYLHDHSRYHSGTHHTKHTWFHNNNGDNNDNNNNNIYTAHDNNFYM